MTSTVTALTHRNVSNFQSSSSREPTPVLRLHGSTSSSSARTRPTVGHNERARHIKWDEKVINNEGMGKKKSKICCIYHAPRPFDESSDESSSCSSDSEGESTNDGENSYSTQSSRRCNSALNDVKDKVILSSSKTISSTTQLPEEKSYEDKNNQDEEGEILNDDICSNHHNLDEIGKRKRKYGKHKKTNGSPNAYERLPKPR